MKRVIFNCILAWVAAVTTWLPTTALAATIAVTTTADNGAGSLRQAIEDAASGDTVTFTVTGIITLTNGQLLITNDLAIIGPGATNLAVSGNTNSRVFEIISNVTVCISGLTVANGWITNGHGAGISNAGTLSLVNCAFLNNRTSGGWGGGLYNAGDFSIRSSTFSGNQARGIARGGGLFTTSGRGSITNSVFIANSAEGSAGGSGIPANGGAIFVEGGVVMIVNCSFVSNSVMGGVGGSVQTPQGIYGLAGGSGHGGGLFLGNAILTIINSTLSSNFASGGRGGFGVFGSPGFGGDGGGGGIFLESGSLTAINMTLLGNASTGGPDGANGPGGGPGRGGGICVYAGTTTNISCTIVSNVAVGAGSPPRPGYGGGIYNDHGETASLNTLVAANHASTDGPDVFGTVTSQGYNLIGVTNGSRGWMAADLTGNINAPVNPMLGPLKDNGGSTWTMALLPGSPAVDQGTSAGLTTDQRGRARPIDNPAITNAPGGDGTDIGAFELQSPAAIFTELIKSGNDIAVSFFTEVGWTYRLERTDVLGSDSWTTVADNVAGTGGTVQVLDSGAATQPQYFYRAVMSP